MIAVGLEPGWEALSAVYTEPLNYLRIYNTNSVDREAEDGQMEAALYKATHIHSLFYFVCWTPSVRRSPVSTTAVAGATSHWTRDLRARPD